MSINKKIFATPKTRKFARELGANISEIAGTQRAGRITNDDVKNYINNKLNNPKLDSKNSKEKTNLKVEFDHSDFGEVEVIDMPRIKRIAAPNLSNSWKSIPHVTHHDEADISELEEFRLSLKDRITGEIKKITPLVFIIKSLVSSLKKFPNFNSSIDEIEKGKITLKKYFHIGVAVDTKHGLMVPKIREADKKNFNQLSENLKEISDKCRKLKIDKKEFFGGSITVTSLGSIGGSFFTPIINYPEVAILGIGKKYYKQVYIDNEFKRRIMLPLSLSYDHRIIDGAEAARFCNDLKENLGKNFAYKLAI
tara:strand:+ start:1053 stop:1979 length:927 start_codon:yes stop_codon:yes gene_type:complete